MQQPAISKPHHNPPDTTSSLFDDTIRQLLIPYGLKEVYRAASIGDRKESVAEHVGSMLFLARWFMKTYDLKLDITRVVDLICFHDLPELEAGDTPIIPGVDNLSEKNLKERAATIVIAQQMAPSERDCFVSVVAEYKAGETDEAKFVRAIDKLDADLQFLGCRDAWASWSDEFYRSKREPYYRAVPAVSDFYDKLLGYLRANGYLRPSLPSE